MKKRAYPCAVIGLRYEGRAAYVRRKVREGDDLTICLEPDNPKDSNAVAVFHRKQKIGYIPARKTWVARSLNEGDNHNVEVTGLVENEDGELVAVDIQITILKDGKRRVAPEQIKKARRGLFTQLLHSLFGIRRG